MSGMQERPARRTKPVPPADAGVDPVDYRPPTPVSTPAVAPDVEDKGAQTPAAAPARREAPASAPTVEDFGAKATVQSGVSWSPETEALVREVKARTGKTRRAIVEEAIASTWSS